MEQQRVLCGDRFCDEFALKIAKKLNTNIMNLHLLIVEKLVAPDQSEVEIVCVCVCVCVCIKRVFWGMCVKMCRVNPVFRQKIALCNIPKINTYNVVIVF